MKIIPAAEDLALSFWSALDQVAKERKYLLMLEGPKPESTVSFVKTIVEKNWTQFYAVEGGELVGWCDIIPQEREGVRHVACVGMGVVSSHRRKGIGRALLIRCIDDAFSKGVERIELEVFASNTGAIKLYQRLGFFTEGVKRNARFIDGEYDDVVVMALLKQDRNQTVR